MGVEKHGGLKGKHAVREEHDVSFWERLTAENPGQTAFT